MEKAIGCGTPHSGGACYSARTAGRAHFLARARRGAAEGGTVRAAHRPPSTGAGFFQKSLVASQRAAPDPGPWRTCLYGEIRAHEQRQGEDGLGVQHLCALARLSRAGYYRFLQEKAPAEENMTVREAIQRLCVAHRHYGSRRVGAQLRREGLIVNRKRVQRLMREDNLLAIRKRKFVVTTDSVPALTVYPNLAKRLTVTAVNQLWVADLTYSRLQQEFVYLAVVLDAYSRKVIGWALSRSLQTGVAVTALQRALASRTILPGLVHHSDRGVQ